MNVLAINMTDQMARLVSKATDILKLPQNQDFALHAMGIVLRSMGLANTHGRPMGYRHSARAVNRRPPVKKRPRRKFVNR